METRPSQGLGTHTRTIGTDNKNAELSGNAYGLDGTTRVDHTAAAFALQNACVGVRVWPQLLFVQNGGKWPTGNWGRKAEYGRSGSMNTKGEPARKGGAQANQDPDHTVVEKAFKASTGLPLRTTRRLLKVSACLKPNPSKVHAFFKSLHYSDSKEI